MITFKVVKEALSYNQQTGVFIRIKATGRRCRIGEPTGWLSNNGYMSIGLNSKVYLAHRLAWLYMTGKWPKDEIDHINGNPLDNRWNNLREASSTINKQNQRKARIDNLGTGLLGAYLYKDKFRSAITVDGKQFHLGVFNTKEEAHRAYIKAKRKYHAGCTI